MSITEVTHISLFKIHPNGCIDVRKTTEVSDGDVFISNAHCRFLLAPNDPRAFTVLDEQKYLSLAQEAWTPEVIAAYQASVSEQQANGLFI